MVTPKPTPKTHHPTPFPTPQPRVTNRPWADHIGFVMIALARVASVGSGTLFGALLPSIVFQMWRSPDLFGTFVEVFARFFGVKPKYFSYFIVFTHGLGGTGLIVGVWLDLLGIMTRRHECVLDTLLMMDGVGLSMMMVGASFANRMVGFAFPVLFLFAPLFTFLRFVETGVECHLGLFFGFVGLCALILAASVIVRNAYGVSLADPEFQAKVRKMSSIIRASREPTRVDVLDTSSTSASTTASPVAASPQDVGQERSGLLLS
jgi:hypothetical protein